MPRLAVLVFLACLLPASAQDRPAPNLVTSGSGGPGGVARRVLAQQLYVIGTTTKDPFTVLNAARLAASVTLTDTPRDHTSSAAPPRSATANPATPADMLAAATALATDNDPVLDLIDASRREAAFAPTTSVVSTQSNLAPSATDTWTLPFFGAALAEVGVLGDGNVALTIVDDNANPICQIGGPSDTAYCSFYPARNGSFVINVTNTGPGMTSYILLTN